ncbi:MAG: ABC transporter substrate-binding protein, partial [Thermomicrobiales bacterium]
MISDQIGRRVTRRSVMGAAWQIPVAAALLSQGLTLTAIPVMAQDGTTVLNWSLEGVSDLVSLDPATASDAQGFTAVGLLYGGLVRLNADLLVEPDLAESWTVSDDGMAYTFTLREGAKFSDGSPITSADVVASLNHALDPSTGAWTGPYYLALIEGANAVAASGSEGPDGTPMPVVTEISGVKAVDDRTVEIRITQPSAYFLSVLSLAPAKIAPAAGAGDGKVTSGPFALEAWNKGLGLVLVPIANYWEPADKLSIVNLIFNQD